MAGVQAGSVHSLEHFLDTVRAGMGWEWAAGPGAGWRPQSSPLPQWGKFAFVLSLEHDLAMGGKWH